MSHGSIVWQRWLMPLILCVGFAPVLGDDVKSTFDSLFAQPLADVKKTPSRTDDLALATRMVEAGRQSANQPELLAMMCDHAFDLARLAPDGHPIAAAALQTLAHHVPARRIEALARLADLHQAQLARAKPDDRPSLGESLIQTLIPLAQTQMELSDDAAALLSLRRAQTLAQQLKSPSLNEVKQLTQQATDRQRISAVLARLQARLKADANDAAAAKEMVMLHVISNDDPAAALPYLAIAKDDLLTRHVQAAGKPLSEVDPSAAADLALWYRDQAEKADAVSKRRLFSRGLDYAQRAAQGGDASDAATQQKAKLIVVMMTQAVNQAGGYVAKGAAAQEANEWIDLLTMVDPKPRTISGVWHKRGRELTTDAVERSRIELPLELHGSYQLSVTFTRSRSNGPVMIWIPVGSGVTTVALGASGGKTHGFHILDGRAVGHEPHNRFVDDAFLNDRPQTALISVDVQGDAAHITTTLGDRTVIDWQGRIERLFIDGTWRFFNRRMPGIGVRDASLTVHEAKVRMIDGMTRRIDRTPFVGGQGGRIFNDTPFGPGILIGLRYAIARDRPIIKAVQPIYLTPQGRQIGRIWGGPDTPWREALARPGYAVESIRMRTGDRLDGFEITFARLTPAGLSRIDKYQSDWQGGKGGKESALTGNGAPVIGIHGRYADDIDAFGLIYATTQNMTLWGDTARLRTAAAASKPDEQDDAQTPPAVAENPAPVTERETPPPRPEPGKGTFFGIPTD